MVFTTGDNPSYSEAVASSLHRAPLLCWIHVSPSVKAQTPSADAAQLGYSTRVYQLKGCDYGEPSERVFQVVVHERKEVENICGPVPELRDRGTLRSGLRERLAPPHLLHAADLERAMGLVESTRPRIHIPVPEGEGPQRGG